MASGTIKAVVPKSDIVDNLTTNDGTKVLSAAQGYALNGNLATKVTIVPNFPNAYYIAADSFSALNKTTKSDIDTYLKSTISSNYYTVFAPLFNMTDGTASGWYLIWRNTNMSSSTQFIKLA